MDTHKQSLKTLKWSNRQRLQYIELMAYYTGVIARSDLTRAFGISDAAATKDLKLYGELAPDNLIYQQAVFGFTPTKAFSEVFADLSPSTVLPMMAENLPVAGGPQISGPGETNSGLSGSIYGITIESLPLPERLPEKEILAPLIRAIKQKKKVAAIYQSLTDRDSRQQRIIEPHSLINTGQRWHIRAYSEDTYDFRDFVLSRFAETTLLDTDAESSPQYDDDWTEMVTLKLAPHPKLEEQKQSSLLLDYHATDGVIELEVRRSLIGYTLKNLSVDTTIDHSMNPNANQLVVVNREEVEHFASWAFKN